MSEKTSTNSLSSLSNEGECRAALDQARAHLTGTSLEVIYRLAYRTLKRNKSGETHRSRKQLRICCGHIPGTQAMGHPVSMLWLLGRLSRIFDVRCFYFYLREHCGANRDRVRQVKRHLARLRRQVWELQEQVKYCSPLGALLVDIRRLRFTQRGRKVGIGTIRRLEAVSIRDLATVANLTVEELVKCGVRRQYAEQIREYCKRRRQ